MDELARRRWMAALAVLAWLTQAAYILMPFDLLPDFIPVIGWLDDLVALVGLLMTTVWMARTVHETGLLTGPRRDVIDAEPYEPIPADVLRAL
ncbi:MAG: DUF1232 domain-containing protein [Myxococcales bacterium]|nr:DUF1232 domain-containing protein [Myxococcales bacterium]MCB9670330.1 DUF1232 domain-containing protein [Alphaproteobacteria bacterium]MCB9693414.1 DUF1232 domain-containing protein [Alphaproteobacteria bacterium]